MLLAKSGLFLRLATRSSLARSFAKKKAPRLVKVVERDEYDLQTALKLVKSSAISPIDESVDILIK